MSGHRRFQVSSLPIDAPEMLAAKLEERKKESKKEVKERKGRERKTDMRKKERERRRKRASTSDWDRVPDHHLTVV